MVNWKQCNVTRKSCLKTSAHVVKMQLCKLSVCARAPQTFSLPTCWSLSICLFYWVNITLTYESGTTNIFLFISTCFSLYWYSYLLLPWSYIFFNGTFMTCAWFIYCSLCFFDVFFASISKSGSNTNIRFSVSPSSFCLWVFFSFKMYSCKMFLTECHAGQCNVLYGTLYSDLKMLAVATVTLW